MNSKPNADTNSMTPLNKDSNIVALNSPFNVSANASAAPARSNRRDSYNTKLHRNMTAPMVALQELSQRVLMKCLQDMFDKIDDALFKLAEKASSNAEQNIFFESMREVRLKRIDIEAQYADALGEGFLQLFTATPVAMDPNASIHKAKVSSQDHSESDLTLMADDTVEEMVAMEAMVARADKRLLQPLAFGQKGGDAIGMNAHPNTLARRSNPTEKQRAARAGFGEIGAKTSAQNKGKPRAVPITWGDAISEAMLSLPRCSCVVCHREMVAHEGNIAQHQSGPKCIPPEKIVMACIDCGKGFTSNNLGTLTRHQRSKKCQKST